MIPPVLGEVLADSHHDAPVARKTSCSVTNYLFPCRGKAIDLIEDAFSIICLEIKEHMIPRKWLTLPARDSRTSDGGGNMQVIRANKLAIDLSVKGREEIMSTLRREPRYLEYWNPNHFRRVPEVPWDHFHLALWWPAVMGIQTLHNVTAILSPDTQCDASV